MNKDKLFASAFSELISLPLMRALQDESAVARDYHFPM
jgi:hypothetical protein